MEEWREERKRRCRIRKIEKICEIVVLKGKEINARKAVEEPQACIGKGI